ncbi:MAG: hypothetical protein JO170_10985 [Verrucomicrobia bacterium]|nr:hypothetical protein [Verrucomicrobiota bacterium]
MERDRIDLGLRFVGALAVVASVFLSADQARAQYAYAPSNGENWSGGFYGYRIATNGTLTPIPGSPFGANSQGYTTAATSTAPSQQFLFTLDNTSGQLKARISGYQIDSNGALTVAPGSPYSVPTSNGTDEIQALLGVTSKTSNCLYIINNYADPEEPYNSLTPYLINKDGSLTVLSEFFFGRAVSVLIRDPAGKFLYGLDEPYIGATPDLVLGASVSSDGSLSLINWPNPSGVIPLAIGIGPGGKYFRKGDTRIC